jgi:N-methylhydantoinase A
VIASHQVCGEWREYERTSTAVASAYVLPRTAAYLDRLADGLRAAGHRSSPFIMQSNGGITTVAAAKRNPISLVESGPASGILGVAALGRLLGERSLLALDIGGTTAKCALLAGGDPKITTSYDIERSAISPGYPIRTPVIDLVEIGNGGGSVAWLDAAGSLNVGPESAGSTPGPVAYGKGGTRPTTTDANLVLGRINPRRFGQGGHAVNLGAIEAAFAALAVPLGLPARDVARGVVRIANANMVNALKLVSLNRGHDPREFKLVAFGGGGPMHACALARELRIPEVIVPPHASVFSAWGMLMVDLRRDYIRTSVVDLRGANADRVHATFGDLQRQAAEEFALDGYQADRLVFHYQLDARYKGQEHTVAVALPDIVRSELAHPASVVDRFHDSHESAYGFRLGNPVEIVNFHLVCFGLVSKPMLPRLERTSSDTASGLIEVRPVDFLEESTRETPIYDRARLSPGLRITGPAVIEEPMTVTVVHPGDRLTVDDYGCLRIEIAVCGGEEQ